MAGYCSYSFLSIVLRIDLRNKVSLEWSGVPKVEGGIVIEILDGAVVYHVPLCQGHKNFG